MKTKLLSLPILLLMFAGLLAACGPENATPTAVPTATLPPPTSTPLPPPPTSTTAAAAAPTTASGGITIPSGSAVSAADQQLIMDAITGTKSLKSYHALVEATGDVFTQAVRVEGDYVSPDKAYFKGTLGGEQIEQLVVGGQSYRKDAGGQWAPYVEATPGADAIPGAPVSTDSLTKNANVLEGLDSLLSAASGFTDLGNDTVNGHSARHFSYKLDVASMGGGGAAPDPETAALLAGMPPLGGGEMWIDPSTKNLDKLTMNVDMGPLMELFTGMLGSMFGTPEPGTPTATPAPTVSMKFQINITVSKQNDPSITVPEPPAGSLPAAPTATTESTGSIDIGASDTPTTGDTSGSSGQTYKVGDTATVAGLKVTVNEVKDVAATDFFKPDAGMKFIAVDVTIENPTSDTIPVSSILETQLEDSTGKTYDLDISATVATGAKQPDGDVAANGKLSGPFGYQVPEDATGLKWTFKDFMNADNKAVFDLGK